MQLLPRMRLLLARRPWIYWAVVATCATVLWWSLASAQASADRARRRWGTTTPVWVATKTAAAGEPVAADRRDYPTALVPESAVATAPAGAAASRPIAAGEVIVAADIGRDSLVPDGWVVFATPAGFAPALAVADPASVFAAGAWLCDGVIASIEPETIDVAVPFECGGPMSTHLTAGELVLAAGRTTRD